MFWTIVAVILIPAIWKGVGQARREAAQRGAAARDMAERQEYFRSLGFEPLPGTGLSPKAMPRSASRAR